MEIARKEHGQQETVMSARCALPTVWGTVTLGDLELNARSMQSQIHYLNEEIYDLRDRVRTLEKKSETKAMPDQSTKRPGPIAKPAKPATRKAAKTARA
jgi:hypothetical protein